MPFKERMSEFQNPEAVKQQEAAQRANAVEYVQQLIHVRYPEADIKEILQARGWSEFDRKRIYEAAVKALTDEQRKEASFLAEQLLQDEPRYTPRNVKSVLLGHGWSPEEARGIVYETEEGKKLATFTKNLQDIGYSPQKIMEALQQQGHPEGSAYDLYSHFSQQELNIYKEKLWYEVKNEHDEKRAAGQEREKAPRGIAFNQGHTRELIWKFPSLIDKDNLDINAPTGFAQDPVPGDLYSSLAVEDLHEYIDQHPEKTEFLVGMISREVVQYWNQMGGYISIIDAGVANPKLLANEKFAGRVNESLVAIAKDLNFIAEQLDVITQFIEPLNVDNPLIFVELKNTMDVIKNSAETLELIFYAHDFSQISHVEDEKYQKLMKDVSADYKQSDYFKSLKKKTMEVAGVTQDKQDEIEAARRAS